MVDPATVAVVPEPMSAWQYAQAHPDQCRVTGLGQFVAAEPPLPRSADGRRADVYELYRSHVRSLAARVPVAAYTVEVPGLELARSPTVGSVAARVGEVVLTDACRYSAGATFDAEPVELPGRSLVIAEGHADSYYHFMLNSLVRLAVVMRTHPRQAFDHVVVTDDGPPFVRDALAMVGIDPAKVVSLRRTPAVRCAHATFGQYLSELVYPHPLAVQLARDLFPRAAYAGRRLYVERATTRRVTNAAAVREALARLGFEPVRCEAMSLAEQARLFAAAEAVVAPHGAGLANLIFCPPGTKVVELLSPRFVETIYWFLAAAAGLDYGSLIGVGDDPPLANKAGDGGWRSDNPAEIEVDVGRLRRLCSTMGL